MIQKDYLNNKANEENEYGLQLRNLYFVATMYELRRATHLHNQQRHISNYSEMSELWMPNARKGRILTPPKANRKEREDDDRASMGYAERLDF